MTCANLQVTDYDAIGAPRGHEIAALAAPLSIVLTQELDGACAALGVSVVDVLVAALGRAIARTIGCGVVAVDAPGRGRSTCRLALSCVGPEHTDATAMLARVHHSTTTRPEHVAHDAPAQVSFVHGPNVPAGLDHALRLCARRNGDVLSLDWWYDARRFEDYTVQELAEQFPYAVIELTSEATGPIRVPEMAIAH